MTVDGWSLVRFLHVLAAIGWVGGQLTLSGVMLPVLRKELDPASRGPLVRKAATRFALLANVVLLPTSLVTGLALLAHRHVSWDIFFGAGYGRLLLIKLTFVTVSVVLAGVHGIIATKHPGSARPLGIAGLVSSLLIVVFATALVP